MWTSTETLFLDKAGRVVRANDPTRVTKLVHAGCQIPMAQARALGLVGAPLTTVATVPVLPEVELAVEPEVEKSVKSTKDKAVQSGKDKAAR